MLIQPSYVGAVPHGCPEHHEYTLHFVSEKVGRNRNTGSHELAPIEIAREAFDKALLAKTRLLEHAA